MVKNKNKKVKGGAKQVNKRPQPGSAGGAGVSKAGVSPPKQAQDKDKGKGKGKGGGKSDRERAEWDRRCAHLKERHVVSKHKRQASSIAAPVLRLGPSVLAATKVSARMLHVHPYACLPV